MLKKHPEIENPIFEALGSAMSDASPEIFQPTIQVQRGSRNRRGAEFRIHELVDQFHKVPRTFSPLRFSCLGSTIFAKHRKIVDLPAKASNCTKSKEDLEIIDPCSVEAPSSKRFQEHPEVVDPCVEARPIARCFERTGKSFEARKLDEVRGGSRNRGSSVRSTDRSVARGRRKLARNLSTREPLLRLRAPRYKRK